MPNVTNSPPTHTHTRYIHTQVGIIGPDKKFKVLTASEVQDYLQEVE